MDHVNNNSFGKIWTLPTVKLDLELGLFVFSIITLLTFLVWRLTTGFNGKLSREKRLLGLDDVPGDKPFLGTHLIGNFVKLLPFSRTVKNGLTIGQKYSNIFKITLINKTFVVLSDASLIQQLFKSSDFGHNTKSPFIYGTMKPFITNGLLVSTGKFWQGQRKVMMRTQSFQSLKAYMEILNKHSKDFIQALGTLFEDGKPHEINEAINVSFLRVICEMITGSNGSFSTEFGRYHNNFETWKESIVVRVLYPYLQLNILWRLHPMSRRVDKAVQEMVDFAKMRIKEHKGNRLGAAKSLEDSDNLPFRSLLDELLDAGVEEDQIVDEVNTMLFGGHETGATAIHFFCFVMALHPHIQQQCQREIDDLHENAEYFQNGSITYEAVHANMKYVERCIQETLRLFPPVFLIARQLQTAFYLKQGDKTYCFPVGSNLCVSPLLTHRNSEYYPDPEKFDPDRFLPEQVAKRPACANVPFSGGPRNCLGIKFAMLELKVIAAYLLRNFEMSTNDRMEDVTLLPYTTTTPAKEFTFEFKKRNV